MKKGYSDPGPCFPPFVVDNILDEGHIPPVVIVADHVSRLLTIQ